MNGIIIARKLVANVSQHVYQYSTYTCLCIYLQLLPSLEATCCCNVRQFA